MIVGRTLRRRSLRTCTSGASALEFAIFAPILCLGLLAMIDVGMSVALRMELDRNVRSGAQAAITLDNPAPIIEDIVKLSAGNHSDLKVRVAESCFCRIESGLISKTCGTGLCPPLPQADLEEEYEPLVFFEISATRPYTGPISKGRAIVSETRVQIR
jgi:pilus assembly protein CpaE